MLSAMARRWVDPSQPQTLQIAVFLLYLHAVFALLLGQYLDGIVLLVTLTGVAAGYGIANEQKWGYGLALLVALFPFIYRVVHYGLNYVLSGDLLSVMIEVVLVLLLLHPQSREYERIWFK
jgi:hypothetical protein